ncbi:integrin alpha-2-like [Chiloscyllium plagiosum]|uniref:integrin alpha-2-like n=1 Tax=Chiloscyllium plagiosum TaxID=36176 RepID=UPI001CB83EBC|nr:integrin alpha-2-like [Chiloscyllium plagiosum]
MFMGQHKNEEGRVYVFSVNQQGSLEKRGILEGPVDGKNSRFGAAIAAVADINLDGYNDVAVGAPVEDEQHGVVYIFNGDQTSILSKHTQRIQASKISHQLQYFGLSIDGQKDLNGDTITDLSIGSIGNVVQLWSRSIATVRFTVVFEPTKLSILNKTCQINGNQLICGKVKICFQATIKPENSVSSINIRYNATFDMSLKSSHATSRALFQTNHMREIQNDISVDKLEKCNIFNFYVNEKIDVVNPLSLRLDFAPKNTEVGPSVDAYTTRSKEFFIPFSKDCGDDEECITDLAIKVHSNIPNNSNYIVSSKKQQMTINVETENKKENAFNAKVIVHFSDNIFFASALNTDCSEVNSTSVSCDIGNPFLKGGDKISFDIYFDFNVNKPQKDTFVKFHAKSGSNENPETEFDNEANVIFTVQYDSEIVFLGINNKNFYEIASKTSVNKTRPPLDQISPENVITLTVNTGHFPIQTAYVMVEIPVSTKKNNRLLYLTDLNHSNNIICDAKLDTLDIANYHSTTFKKESFSSFNNLNCENVNCEKFLCIMNNLKMNNQYTIKIAMRIWLKTFINADFQRITLTPSAKIETRNPLFIINANNVTMPVEISKPMKKEVPIGVIVGSVIGGLLVLLALIAVLWKLGFFKRKYTKLQKDEEDNENNGDQDAEEE